MAGKRVDGSGIFIQKESETADYIDYFFESDVWQTDPRFNARQLKIGQIRGLFRLDKATLVTHLLLPMEGDSSKRIYKNAVGKVIKVYQNDQIFPEKTAFMAG